MKTNKKIHIDPLSLCSLRLILREGGQTIGIATGFVVKNDIPLLITNWHVLSGRDPATNKILNSKGKVPDEVGIIHRHVNGLGHHKVIYESLYDGNVPNWIEHTDGKTVDVTALPLTQDPEIKLYPIQLEWANQDVMVDPALAVSVIGYPYGIANTELFPIWKTGHIASDPDIDYNGSPVFLIDATTRSGMSGSPVLYKVVNNYRNKSGEAMFLTQPGKLFLGVYSGRIHSDSEVGKVWKPHVIRNIQDNVE